MDDHLAPILEQSRRACILAAARCGAHWPRESRTGFPSADVPGSTLEKAGQILKALDSTTLWSSPLGPTG